MVFANAISLFQAQYVADSLNAAPGATVEGGSEFHFFQRGAMAQLGLGKGVVDVS